jgi:hypothetical protein
MDFVSARAQHCEFVEGGTAAPLIGVGTLRLTKASAAARSLRERLAAMGVRD